MSLGVRIDVEAVRQFAQGIGTALVALSVAQWYGPSLMNLLIPLVTAAVGAALYLLVQNGKLNELGRIAFFVGLFWLVAEFAHGHLALTVH